MADKNAYRKKTELKNRAAQWVISTGGYGVIIIIVAMLAFLIYQVLPLSFDAALGSPADIHQKNNIKLAGVDPYQEVVYTIDKKGIVRFFNRTDSLSFASDTLRLEAGENILCVSPGQISGDIFSAGTDQGRILTAEIRMRPYFEGSVRSIVPEFKARDAVTVITESDSLPAHIESLVYRRNDSGEELWVWKDHDQRFTLRLRDEYDDIYQHELNSYAEQKEITAVTIDPAGEKIVLGTRDGYLYVIDVSANDEISIVSGFHASGAAITALSFLLGNTTIICGDESGQVTSWLPVRSSDGALMYQQNYSYETHNSSVTDIAVSARNRSFLTCDKQGTVHLNYGTTGRTSLTIDARENAIKMVRFAPKSDGILLVDESGGIALYPLENEHPNVTLSTLFGKVHYEGYEQAEFVWQSTGGTDEFEPKFSLVPLIFGTLKGTLYAMMFSIPLALLAAIYVSQFAPVWLARSVKPTIEIMAALPSVVIGFLAGLYFSPVLEKYLAVAFLAIILIPAVILIGILIWRYVPEEKRARAPKGWELLFITPLVILAIWLSIHLAHPVELALFAGNIKQWLYESLGVSYDQRNSIIVGFALGFAVIPTMFTISEDALSNVPGSLTSASLALGASRWQTVKYVIIPAAAGGIFAATMLGLGRAIGETMIVLMATGNTPIMDISPFNGFRAMSACIAVEIPEAPVGGTLYHILFLTALLLFAFTFLLNTLAAFVGDRLRKKYARF